MLQVRDFKQDLIIELSNAVGIFFCSLVFRRQLQMTRQFLDMRPRALADNNYNIK